MFSIRSLVPRGLVVATALTVGVSAPVGASPNSWSGSKITFASLDPTKPISIAGHQYRGSLIIDSSGNVTNELSLDDYVKGISEVPSAWPEEALKAQAIAARTYVMWTLQHRETICATTSCQVYSGVAKENADYGERWVKAVEDTAGQVLQYGGSPIKAMYSSSNGGYTASGAAPYLRAVPDPDDAASPLHRWDFSVPTTNLGSRFGFAGSTYSVSSDPGGFKLVQLEGSKKVSHIVDKVQFRSAINRDFPPPPGRSLPLPSYRYEFSVSGSTISIIGHGYGHGIGMSQYGALGKARRGLSATQILAAYYSGITPTQIGTEPVRVELGQLGSNLLISPSTLTKVDIDGQVLAYASKESWNVAISGGLTVSTDTLPNVPKISSAAIEFEPSEHDDGIITFNLNQPAALNLRVFDPTSKVVETIQDAGDFAVVGKSDPTTRALVSKGIVPSGKVRIRIPSVKPGSYSAVITAASAETISSSTAADFRIARQVAPEVLQLKQVVIPAELSAYRPKRSVVVGAAIFFLPWLFMSAGVALPFRRRKSKFRHLARFVPTGASD